MRSAQPLFDNCVNLMTLLLTTEITYLTLSALILIALS